MIVAGRGKNKSPINKTMAIAQAHAPYPLNQSSECSQEKKAINVSPQIKKGINTIATRAMSKKIRRIDEKFKTIDQFRRKIGIDHLLFF
jgi:alanine dehydrogenase